MNKTTFTIDIKAPKQKVWDIMLGDRTYREWTAVFREGSYFDGSWDKGSKIKFLAADDGRLNGMVCKIAENIPYEFVSIEALGEVIDGTEKLDSEWAGSLEEYRFAETNGVTTLTVQLSSEVENKEMTDYLAQMWPAALKKLKETVEK